MSTFQLAGEVFGIEFSATEDRLYLTLEGDIIEFTLEDQDVSDPETVTPPSFIADLTNAVGVAAFSDAVLASKNEIERGNFRAIQRSPGPLNLLLVGEPGDGAIGILNEGRFSDIPSLFTPDFLPFFEWWTLGE
ncbi:hypothetical protein A3SI_15583 [Nitritalea halalkaliphila LW7]|uniref:Uncharacterized protein n=1 Tax=Nitritalea halalkaliphila LW7 TaxID=1189621 RepID=I5BYA1_9BACT|nr:hypothetical protein [Nitritalea halalkaliphila]EIM74553.1 hypothetical protein A3SI_15583 [Nitritalea halalkaliphila LW7]